MPLKGSNRDIEPRNHWRAHGAVGVLSVQKVLSSSGCPTSRWPAYFPMRRSLPARPEPDNKLPFGLIKELKSGIFHYLSSTFHRQAERSESRTIYKTRKT